MEIPPMRPLLITGLFLGGLSAADVTSLSLINAATDQPIAGYDPIPAGVHGL
jgi:hypothetical protein